MSELQQNLVCFNTFGEEESWTLATYEKHDGYKVWRNILAGKLTPDKVIDEVKAKTLGINNFLNKPVDIATLKEFIIKFHS